MIIKRKTVKELIHFYFSLLLVSTVSAIVITEFIRRVNAYE